MFEQFFSKLFSMIVLENTIVQNILYELGEHFEKFNDKLDTKLNRDV